MKLFESLRVEDKRNEELDKELQGSLFHSIEYELSGIVNKIKDINNLNDQEIRDIIVRQHVMILNYDLFLLSPETRSQALILFTNQRFLSNFLEVIRVLELSKHEKICLNKIAYDYYILPDHDKIISDLLYRLTTEVNGKEVIVLSGIYGLYNAQILSMIRNSTFKEEKAIHRVNTYMIKCNVDLTVEQIVSTYCFLFERFTYPFIYTMLESRVGGLSELQYKKFDSISIALLSMMNSLPSHDINKLLLDYGFTLKNLNYQYPVRFALKTAVGYPRILREIENIEINHDDIKIP